MEKMIKVGDREVAFKATGATLRIYRQRFQRDMLVDIQKLQKEMQGGKQLTSDALEIFENVAYVMAKQADPDIPDTPDEWLDGFDMFSIYEILPQIVALWGVTMTPISESKKKASKPKGH